MSDSTGSSGESSDGNRSMTTNANGLIRNNERNGSVSEDERVGDNEAPEEVENFIVNYFRRCFRLSHTISKTLRHDFENLKVFRGLWFGRAPVSRMPFVPDEVNEGERIGGNRFLLRNASVFLVRGQELPVEVFPIGRDDGSVILGTTEGFRSSEERIDFYNFLREESNQALHRTQFRRLVVEEELHRKCSELLTEHHQGFELVEQPWAPSAFGAVAPRRNGTRTFFAIRHHKMVAIRYDTEDAVTTEDQLPDDSVEHEVFFWRSVPPTPYYGWENNNEKAQFRSFVEEKHRELLARKELDTLARPYDYEGNLLNASGITARQLIARRHEGQLNEDHPQLPGDDITNTDNVASVFHVAYLLEIIKQLEAKIVLLEQNITELAASGENARNTIEGNGDPEEDRHQPLQLPGDRFLPHTGVPLIRVASLPNLEFVFPPIVEPHEEGQPDQGDAPAIAIQEDVPEEQVVEEHAALDQLPEEPAVEDNVPAVQQQLLEQQPKQHPQIVVEPLPPLPVVQLPPLPYIHAPRTLRLVPRVVKRSMFPPKLPIVRRELPYELYKYRMGGYMRNSPPVMRRRPGRIDGPRFLLFNPDAARHADVRFEDINADWNVLIRECQHDPDFATLNPIKLRDSLLSYFANPNHRYSLPSLAAVQPAGLKRYENKTKGIDEGEDCPACSAPHYFSYCFVLLLVSERRQFILDVGYCLKCLGGHNPSQPCYFKTGTDFGDYQCSNKCFPVHHQTLCPLELMDQDRRLYNDFRCNMGPNE